MLFLVVDDILHSILISIDVLNLVCNAHDHEMGQALTRVFAVHEAGGGVFRTLSFFTSQFI